MPRRRLPLTRSFNETVRARAARDSVFRAALFREAIRAFLEGDLDTVKAALRAYVNATIGFKRLAKATGIPARSLMRMFGPKANLRASQLFTIVAVLQKQTGVRLKVRAAARAA